MKKRITSFVLAMILTLGLLPAVTPTASAASVSSGDMDNLASAAQQAIGSSAADLGLPAGDWCGYFVGNRINNSQIAAKLGTIPYSACAYAISLVSWICATKDAGVFYAASPVHQNRLLEIDPRLGNNGRMVSRTNSGWSPLPGDILQFSWSNWNLHTFDHTGIVVSVKGDIITYVDGNSSAGRVAAHTIRKDSSTIIGHIRFNIDNTIPPNKSPEYFDCSVMIYCVNGKVVNLYNNPGDSARSDYFSLGQSVHSAHGVKMNDGSTWYQISASSLGVVRTFWLKYESDKMTLDDLQAPQPTPCSHTWDAGVETASPTLTTSGTRLYTCTACGETKTESIGHRTSVSGTCGDNARWKIDDQGTLTVSGTGKVIYQSWPWDEYPKTENRDTVKRIVVEEGITELSVGALFYLPNAISVELPQSLISIDGDVFWQCYSLKEVTIPAHVSYLHPQAFRQCTSLTNIKVDDANPFMCCYNGAVFSKDMRKLVCFPGGRSGSFCVPEGVTSIENRVFSWALSLGELQLPQSIGYIGSVVFPGQDKISSDAPGKTDLTLIVFKGSYAERYAIENSLEHRVIDVPAVTMPNHLDRFKRVKTYKNGIFQDVNAGAWYAENISAVYEFGLMKGTGERTFEPVKNVTVAETITLAARLHSTYYADGVLFDTYDGGNWYDPYVNYMRNNNLLSENYNYDRPATREEFVHILAQALPNEALAPILSNAVSFADAGSILYQFDVDLFSQAGIITGSRDNGTLCFYPHSPISRAEMAAVATRMVNPDLRKG